MSGTDELDVHGVDNTYCSRSRPLNLQEGMSRNAPPDTGRVRARRFVGTEHRRLAGSLPPGEKPSKEYL
jgi:hypothetical protein